MNSILPLIKKINNHLASGKNDLLKEFDLTGTQFEMLKFIHDQHDSEITQKDICQYFEVRHTSAIHSLKALENKEFIIKKTNEHNARYKNFYITRKGIQAVETSGKGWQKLNEIFVEDLTDEDQTILYQHLSHCYNNLLQFKDSSQ